MSFFTDALGDSMISGGNVTGTVHHIYYNSGFAEMVDKPWKFKAKKSIQPLSPEEAQLMGYPDYSTNEFITIFSLQKIPMPTKMTQNQFLHLTSLGF